MRVQTNPQALLLLRLVRRYARPRAMTMSRAGHALPRASEGERAVFGFALARVSPLHCGTGNLAGAALPPRGSAAVKSPPDVAPPKAGPPKGKGKGKGQR